MSSGARVIEVEIQNETHQTQERLRFASVPRIGEGVRLREPDGCWASYDVLDVWYQKAEFGDGSGARDVLSEAIEAGIPDAEFEAERGAVDPPLRTKEELAYYRVWREHLDGISPERTLSRFARA